MFRVGQGFDVHEFAEGRPLIIGGIEVPSDKGLLGHSDADVLLHTVTDAALGAIGEGDIGHHFPDTDPEWEGADSAKLLAYIWDKVEAKGYTLGNVDCTIMAQAPKMAPYIDQMRALIHAEQPDATRSAAHIEAPAVIFNHHPDSILILPDRYCGLLHIGIFPDVRERFLDDAVDGGLRSWKQPAAKYTIEMDVDFIMA